MTTKHPTFRQWLAQHRRLQTAIGDLARDIAKDRHAPRSAAALPNYLHERGACQDAIRTAYSACAMYRLAFGTPGAREARETRE